MRIPAHHRPSPASQPGAPRPRPAEAGIALILVLGAIVVLTALVAGFTYSMKVEARLAMNNRHEAEMEWMARSGVELARFILAQELLSPEGRMFDALNQKWAGGVGSPTNEILAGISLTDNQIGRGRFALSITDQERRFNINSADQFVLSQALLMMNVDASLHATIVDSILDWRDPDDDPRLNGAESDDFYLRLDPPYFAKNGPIDDLSELLLVRGITPEIYWGSGSTNVLRSQPVAAPGALPRFDEEPYIVHGLRDLFTAVSAPQVNINTCSAETLQLAGLDPLVAQFVLEARRGPDGVDGTEDDMPFRSTAQIPVPGNDPALRQQIQQYFTIRSRTFEVIVTCDIGGYVRQYRALLDRRSQRDIVVLFLHAL
ncbi:MAG: general secretion pathway protein GspK [Verrucomicrobiae bacterium]|nr:general secretion pathway protein GspK [Verrucomicrobiae bacterium]